MTYEPPHPDAPADDRQRRAVLALAAAVAVLAVAGLGFLLLQGGDDDRLETTPTPPATTAPPSAEPTAEPAPGPTAEPGPATPDPVPGFDVEAALLSPEAASEAEQPGFAVLEGADSDPGPVLDPCGDREAPGLEQVTASVERTLASTREAGGSALVQEVYRYETAEDAEAALDTYRQRVADCPRADVEGTEDSIESAVVEGASGDDRLLVQARYCNPACTDIFTTYAMAARSGTGLTVATYAVGEDGDPGQYAEPLLDALAEALAAAAS